MKYQVTATRRRPQKFSELLGQDFVAATLQKSIEAGKIAQAYLFSGPRGCGKTSSARILAKALNCESGPAPNPCGKCNYCEEITAGANLDVIEIDGASNTGIDDVRKIKDEILFPPNSGRYKIYIIDEVHMLSTSAFNALLKTIEEPPPYVIFIFATTELHKVPATIKSRCQQFNFKLVDVETLKTALEAVAKEQGIDADDEALFWIAREATGSVRDSYTLFDQVAAFSDGHITFEKIQDKLGLTGIDSINSLFSACVNKNANEALHITDEILKNGVSVEQFTIDCTKYLRSLMMVKYGITKEAILGQQADRFPVEVVQGWNEIQVERAFSLMLSLFKDIRFSVNPRYELELTVSRLAWLSDYVSPADLKIAYTKMRKFLKSQNTNVKLQENKPDDGHVPNPIKNAFAKMKAIQDEGKPDFEQIPNSEDTNHPFHNADSFISQTQINLDNTNQAETVRRCDFSELKEKIVSDLSSKNGMISMALKSTAPWQKEENKIIIPVKNNFELEMLQKEKAVVMKRVHEIFDEHCFVEFCEYKENVETQVKQTNDIPIEVQKATEILHGKIVSDYLIKEKE
ncbi:MAG: DNA polymerase III subunit gamma/tau [Treponema sp.]|nr:MAG: DNA polymerase III subunit gamma/tau [Treponema sp.]